jgi:hypothetical protein
LLLMEGFERDEAFHLTDDFHATALELTLRRLQAGDDA